MDWLAANPRAPRRSARAVAAASRSMIMLGVNYGPDDDPLAMLEQRDARRDLGLCAGRRLSRRDQGRLKPLARWLARHTGGEVKVFVDTAPVMEKPLAQAAGTRLAGQAHQSRLARIRLVAVSRRDLHRRRTAARCARDAIIAAPAAPASTSARPTPSRRPTSSMRGAAFPISPSSTRAPIPREFREAIGNRIYGCDDCLAVCPWNKFAQAARERRSSRRAPISPRRRWPNWRGSTMPAFRALFRRLAGQAHRPRPLPAQCADRDRQFRRSRRLPRRPNACSPMRARWCAAPRCGRCRS